MRSSPIVMAGPGFKRLSDVGFVEWNHKIETFSTCTADQALAKCIRLGRLIRSLQHSQPKRLQRLIQVLRIDTVTIMDNESVSFVTANAFSELLKRPLGRRMLSDVKVKDAPGVEFHDHEHVDQPERCCHNDKEVGGDDGLRVIAHESHPALGRVRRTPRGLRNIASNRPRRNLNSDFQQEFVGDAFLTPCGIVRRHFNNQLLHVGRHTWTATGSRFPFPKHSEPAAVPANQCVGLDDREGVPPVEETREMGKRKTNGVGSAPRLDLSLNVEAELFAEEQILGGNSSR